MKTRFKYFFLTYVFFVLIFIIQKPLFMLYHLPLFKEATWKDWFLVPYHGLPLDFSLAGYLTIIPGLLLICTIWSRKRLWRRLAKAYFAVIAIILSAVFVIDLGLYRYWGFRLDATPLFYFCSSPGDALASASAWELIGGIVTLLLMTALLYALFYLLLRDDVLEKKLLPLNRPFFTFLFVLLWAALFIPIRGGFKASTMNIGKVYFSENMRLNHAATNPLFSLLVSLIKQENFKQQYRFMKDDEANKLVAQMYDQDVVHRSYQAPQQWILTTARPNILFVVMESFSSKLMASLGGERNVAVNLDRLSAEGLLFRHFYATSFRTDRGLVSILSGFPSLPTNSIMKMPKVSQSLPSLAASLRKVGYTADYYYGGDADFTNMRSYLKGTGFETIVCDEDFPLSDRLSKWGVPDHLLFEKVLSNLRQNKRQKPWFKVVQTLSSHEPFDVPYHRLNDKILNAFAYTDSCVGHFVDELKKLPLWKKTLIVLVPDHLGCYPQDIDNLSVERYQIPLIFLGGALKGPGTVDIHGSQTDIAATLLGQMGIAHHEFTYSKDMFNPSSPHFAFFTFPDAFGLVDEDNQVVFNNESKKVVLDRGKRPGKNLKRGKAYLQKIYDTIDRLATEPVKEGNRHEVRRE